MKLIFIFLLLLWALLIIKYSGMKRFLIFFIGVVMLPYVVAIPTPYLPSYRLLTLSVLISVILRYRSFISAAKYLPCVWVIALVYISHILTSIMDSRVSTASGLWKSNMAFIDTFALIFVGYFSLYKNTQFNTLNRFLIVLGLIVSIYGIISGILGRDLYCQIVGLAFGGETDFTPLHSLTRTRITSFLFNSHIFGFFCSVLFTIILHLNYKNLCKSKVTLIALIFLFLGVYFSGSRSSLLGLFIAITISVLLSRHPIYIIRYICCCTLGLCLALTIPNSREKISSVVDAFTESGGKTEGSSIAMRKNQLDISLLFFKQSPIWGNGFDYFTEVLTPDKKLIYGENLLGAESYYFILLIESGLVQIICISLFFITLIIYLLLQHRYTPVYSILGISLITQFLIVSIVTGNYSKWQYLLPFIGMILRAIVNEKKQKNETYNQILVHRPNL